MADANDRQDLAHDDGGQLRSPLERWADAGQIMSVFCADKRYKDMSGEALYLKIMPALSLGQYVILRKPRKLFGVDETLPSPIAAILWAKVSDRIHEMFLAATTPVSLAVGDWDSGDNYWIIDAPGDQKAVGDALEALQQERFGEQPFTVFINPGDGRIRAKTFGD